MGDGCDKIVYIKIDLFGKKEINLKIAGSKKMGKEKKRRQHRLCSKNNKKEKISWWVMVKEALYVLTSLVTIAASVATCFTVILMRDERNQAYKPYFIFRTANYTQEIEQPVYSISDVTNLIVAKADEEKQIIPMTILLENIGSGTATNIEVYFSYGEEKDYMEEICRYYYDSEYELTDEYLEVKYDLLQSNEIIPIQYSLNEIKELYNKSYIYAKEGIEITVPEEYCELLYLLAYCTNGDYNKENIPSIKVGISYNDLQGIEYYEEIILRAEVHVDLNADKDKNYVRYIIEEL